MTIAKVDSTFKELQLVIIMVKTINDFVASYGEQVLSIIESCDGRRSLATISRDLNIPIGTLKYVAEELVLAGLLEIIF